MKRTALRGLTFSICSAISRIVPEPEPLSLMPGPSSTPSRCAPTTITLSARPDVCATTLRVGRFGIVTRSTFTRAVRPVGPLRTPLRSSLPTAVVAASTGMSPVVAGLKPARPLRAGVSPSFMRMIAEAPALIAFWIFRTKSQVPRWMRAIEPTGKPAKSAASQPLVEPAAPPGLGTFRSTAVTGAVTSLLSAGVRLVGTWNWIPRA